MQCVTLRADITDTVELHKRTCKVNKCFVMRNTLSEFLFCALIIVHEYCGLGPFMRAVLASGTR